MTSFTDQAISEYTQTRDIEPSETNRGDKMVQFEVAEAVLNSKHPISKQELVTKLELHPSTVGAGIKACVDKGYIKENDGQYITTDEFDKEKLESIRPRTIDELRETTE